MHELSLVEALFAELKEAAVLHNGRRISRVLVKIGPFSGVVVDSFSFAFDVLKKDEKLLKQARLEIIRPSAMMRCSLCGREVEVSATGADSPGCSFLPGLWSRDIKCRACGNGALYPLRGMR